MSKNMKILLFTLYFFIISLAIFLILAIFTENGANIAQSIFAPKHYISFDKLEEVTICYKSDSFSCESDEDTIYYEVVVNDKAFLELIEKTYRNKIVNDYQEFRGILAKGQYKIIIDEKTELCTCGLNGFILDYNNNWILVKPNEEIFQKMIEYTKGKLNEEL